MISSQSKKEKPLILIFAPASEVRELIVFCIESKFSCHLKLALTTDEANKIINESSNLKLLILAPNQQTADFNSADLVTKKIPVITIHDPSQNQKPTDNVMANVPINSIEDQLIKCLETNFKDQLNLLSDDDFCQINLELILKMGAINSTVYIKISENKYIKLYKPGTILTQDEVDKLSGTRKVRSLYIRVSESAGFIEKYKDVLAKVAAELNPDNPDVISKVAQIHDTVRELSRKVGFTDQIQRLAMQSIKVTVLSIGKHPNISALLAKAQVLEGQSYLSKHSILLANLSCSIASLMGWPSEQTFMKLVLASFFHDFTLTDDALAKVGELKRLNEMRSDIGEKAYNEILNHPLHGAEIIRKLKEIPGDVDFLLYQHHEKPDGSGFPNGLKSNQIVALSALFIVAHDLAELVLEKGDGFNMTDFLSSFKNTYDTGAFKAIYKILSTHSVV